MLRRCLVVDEPHHVVADGRHAQDLAQQGLTRVPRPHDHHPRQIPLSPRPHLFVVETHRHPGSRNQHDRGRHIQQENRLGKNAGGVKKAAPAR